MTHAELGQAELGATHVLPDARKTWMPATSAGMTEKDERDRL
jgi:hypothetical protein